MDWTEALSRVLKAKGLGLVWLSLLGQVAATRPRYAFPCDGAHLLSKTPLAFLSAPPFLGEVESFIPNKCSTAIATAPYLRIFITYQ